MKNTIKQQVVVKQSCQIKENHLVNTYVEDPRQQPSGMTTLFNNPSPALSGILSRKGRGKQRGFTLIELLVVVLIIGILAAVALPQYQKAVLKSQLAAYMPLVNAIAQAEEIYYLANGDYTYELEELDVELPTAGCKYITNDQYGQFYYCPSNRGTFSIGVWNGPSNAQYQTSNIAYIQFFKDSTGNVIEYKKGDIWCFSKNDISRAVCKSLGEGTEYEDSPWTWTYKLKK